VCETEHCTADGERSLKSGARKNTQVKHTSTNVTGIPESDSQYDSVALAAIPIRA